ncbi:hypothetical protein D3C87_145730 [compost metagenome]
MKNKITTLLSTILFATVLNLEANAACIPHEVAESAVAGRTYVLTDSSNPKNAVYLKFGSSRELKAAYGRVSDGRPVGKYHFHGNCHGDVIVTFTSYFGSNPEPEEVLHLSPTDHEYFQLQTEDGTVFTIVTDIH